MYGFELDGEGKCVCVLFDNKAKEALSRLNGNNDNNYN